MTIWSFTIANGVDESRWRFLLQLNWTLCGSFRRVCRGGGRRCCVEFDAVNLQQREKLEIEMKILGDARFSARSIEKPIKLVISVAGSSSEKSIWRVENENFRPRGFSNNSPLAGSGAHAALYRANRTNNFSDDEHVDRA